LLLHTAAMPPAFVGKRIAVALYVLTVFQWVIPERRVVRTPVE